jgi:hypothetical protein
VDLWQSRGVQASNVTISLLALFHLISLVVKVVGVERRHLSWQSGDRVDGVVGGDLLNLLAATDRPMGRSVALNSGLWVRHLLIGGGPEDQGRCPPQRLTMGAIQKSQTTSARYAPGKRHVLASRYQCSRDSSGKLYRDCFSDCLPIRLFYFNKKPLLLVDA